MKAFIAAVVALGTLAACSTYDSAASGGTAPYGGAYDYQGEAASHNSAL